MLPKALASASGVHRCRFEIHVLHLDEVNFKSTIVMNYELTGHKLLRRGMIEHRTCIITLVTAYDWLLAQRKDHSHNNSIWHVRVQWEMIKPALILVLFHGEHMMKSSTKAKLLKLEATRCIVGCLIFLQFSLPAAATCIEKCVRDFNACAVKTKTVAWPASSCRTTNESCHAGCEPVAAVG